MKPGKPLTRKTPLRPGKPMARGAALARSTPIPARNPKRRTSEFARCYHSKGFVRFTKASPCYACGSTRGSDCAHGSTDGMGRKAGWETIFPLCSGLNGCHARQHRQGWLAIGMTHESRARAAQLHRLAWSDHSHRGTDDATD